MRWATFALESGDPTDPAFWEVLAAAYAEAGEFESASAAQERALGLTENPKRVARMRLLVERYQAKTPLRRSP